MNKAIAICNNDLIFSNEKTLSIDNYLWQENDYSPKVDVYLCHNVLYLALKFIIFETETRAVVTKDNGEVWCDSCAEFFVRPFEDDLRYLNFEINPNGAMILSIGQSRHNRIPLVKKYKKYLSLKTEKHSDRWQVEYKIPFKILHEIYDNYTPIKYMKANFYKCGDKTKYPHFGAWNFIDLENPDFHCPEFFGDIILEN